jgi:hypothetical protein
MKHYIPHLLTSTIIVLLFLNVYTTITLGGCGSSCIA